MPDAEFKPRNVVVRTLNCCPNLEEPPAPFGALEAEQAPPWVIELIDVLEQPAQSVEHPASVPKH